MKSRLDDVTAVIAAMPLPWYFKYIVRFTPRRMKSKLLSDLLELYSRTNDEKACLELAAREWIRVIPMLTLQMYNLALLVADILIFAVVVHSFSVAGVLAVAAAVTGFMVARAQYSPYPENMGELLVGSLVSMTFFVLTGWVALSVMGEPLPIDFQIHWVFAGFAASILPGLAFYSPNWDPEKYTREYREFRWAYGLNYAWMMVWIMIQKTKPQFSLHGIENLITFVPITFVSVTMWWNSSRNGFKTLQKDDSRAFSIRPNVARIHAVKRQRTLLYAFTRHDGEWVVFGAMAVQFVALWFLNPHFDRMQAAASLASSAMMVGIWGYIRRANRRADALLKAELEKLQAEQLEPLRPIQPFQPINKDKDVFAGVITLIGRPRTAKAWIARIIRA